jgi:DNA-binding MarR family transcriptional regulator
MRRTLITQLRHLLEQLDGAVERAYERVGLDYRTRYTPVMHVLIERGSATVGEIAESAGITQPAATQTIALMVSAGLASAGPGVDDARKRVIRLTLKGSALETELQRCWNAAAIAEKSLDRDLKTPLEPVLEDALAALKRLSYDERIENAHRKLRRDPSPRKTAR